MDDDDEGPRGAKTTQQERRLCVSVIQWTTRTGAAAVMLADRVLDVLIKTKAKVRFL